MKEAIPSLYFSILLGEKSRLRSTKLLKTTSVMVGVIFSELLMGRFGINRAVAGIVLQIMGILDRNWRKG